MPKPGTDRLISATSAIFVGVRGLGSQIRLSRGIRTTDDAFWFYGRVVGSVQSQPSSTSLVVSPASAFTVLGDGDTVPNGSPVTFQRPSDGVVVASAAIVSQSAPTSSPPQVTYVFDRVLPGAVVGTVMYSTDATFNGANSLIERSTVQNQSTCCGGVYVTGLANTAVRGNYINRTAFHGVFGVQPMTEGGPPVPPLVNFTVSNNVIDGTNRTSDWWWFQMGAIQTETLTSGFTLFTGSPFSNVNVTNNFIADAGRSARVAGEHDRRQRDRQLHPGAERAAGSGQRESGEARRRAPAAGHRHDVERHHDREQHDRSDVAATRRHRRTGSRAGRLRARRRRPLERVQPRRAWRVRP